MKNICILHYSSSNEQEIVIYTYISLIQIDDMHNLLLN